jgi:hypothetical protein
MGQRGRSSSNLGSAFWFGTAPCDRRESPGSPFPSVPVSKPAKTVRKYRKVPEIGVKEVKSAKSSQKKSNKKGTVKYAIAHFDSAQLAAERLPQRLCRLSPTNQTLGWVGLEPTTNALKGRKESIVSGLL